MIRILLTIIGIQILFQACSTHINPILSNGHSEHIQDTIWICENMEYPKSYAIKFVTDEWGLKPYYLAYEMPSNIRDSDFGRRKLQENLETVRTKNISVWKKYDSILKKDSQKLFRDQIETEISRIKYAQTILDSDTIVQTFLKNTYKTGEFIIPVVYHKLSDTMYVWRLREDLEEFNDFIENGPHTDFYINLKNQKILLHSLRE